MGTNSLLVNYLLFENDSKQVTKYLQWSLLGDGCMDLLNRLSFPVFFKISLKITKHSHPLLM